MTELKTIEVAELGQIKVNAKMGASIFDVTKECIALANLLKCAVQLYFNEQYIDIYVDSTAEGILNKYFKQKA